MKHWINPYGNVSIRGRITLPGDKSICHRAVILSSLASGVSRIRNFAGGEDNLRTLRALRKLGVGIRKETDGALRVQGKGLHSLKEPAEIITAGNSGTTLRLLAGLLAGQSFLTILTGDRSLRRRPMGRIAEPLRLMGAEIWGREGGNKAPLAIRGGNLRGIHYQMPVASAQVKSALLLAGLYARGETEIMEPPDSGGSRDHTERMLGTFGVEVEMESGRVRIRPPARDFPAGEISIPGDISAAAFYIVAALLLPGSELAIEDVGLNPGRTGIIDALRQMGGQIDIESKGEVNGEPVGTIRVRSSSLEGKEFRGALIVRLLDEIPVLAVAAAAAKGMTRIRDARELRVKESDRLKAVARELSRAGVTVGEYPDGLDIRGGSCLRPVCFSPSGDHRMVMACTVASLLAGPGSEVRGIESVAISYPGFFRDVAALIVPS